MTFYNLELYLDHVCVPVSISRNGSTCTMLRLNVALSERPLGLIVWIPLLLVCRVRTMTTQIARNRRAIRETPPIDPPIIFPSLLESALFRKGNRAAVVVGPSAEDMEELFLFNFVIKQLSNGVLGYRNVHCWKLDVNHRIQNIEDSDLSPGQLTWVGRPGPAWRIPGLSLRA